MTKQKANGVGVHPTKNFDKFEKLVSEVLYYLFPGYGPFESQKFFKSTNVRPDFTSIRKTNPKDRMIVEAKFYSSTLNRAIIRDVYSKYSGHPFYPKHIVIVMPENCDLARTAKSFAEEKSITIVQLPVKKLPIEPKKGIFLKILNKEREGENIVYDDGLTPDKIAESAKFITGPYMDRRGRPKKCKET